MIRRREFLGAGAGAALAAAIAAQAANGDKMRFAYSGSALTGEDDNGDQKFNQTDEQIKANFKLCARYGFQGVEPFRGQMGHLNKDLMAFKAILDESGLKLCTVTGGGDIISPNKVAATIEDNFNFTRDFLKPLGCQHLKINIAGAGGRTPGGTPTEQLKAAARGCNELGKRVNEELGMKMGFHPHIWSPVENEHEMNAILEMTDPRYVGLVPDTAHLVLAGMDPVKVLRDNYSRIVAVHIKDTDAKYRNWRGPTPTREQHKERNLYRVLGSGGVDFAAFFRVLREHNYSYWVDLDYDAARKDEGTLEQQLAANAGFLRDKLKFPLSRS
jgi:inosose dehydratase